MAESGSLWPLWQIVGSLVGAFIAVLSAWRLEGRRRAIDRRSRSTSLRTALAAEATALAGALLSAAEATAKNADEEGVLSPAISIPSAAVTVYSAAASELGLLDIEVTLRVVQCYSEIIALLDASGGLLNIGPASSSVDLAWAYIARYVSCSEAMSILASLLIDDRELAAVRVSQQGRIATMRTHLEIYNDVQKRYGPRR